MMHPIEVHTLLIIDDDQDFVADLLHLWRPAARVFLARRGAEALRLLADDPPDLVLLDLDLPRSLAPLRAEEGFAVLRHIRQVLQSEVPVIVITGRSRPEDQRRALVSGADAFLSKPIDLENLHKRIGEIGLHVSERDR